MPSTSFHILSPFSPDPTARDTEQHSSGSKKTSFVACGEVVLDHVARPQPLHRQDHPPERVHGGAKDRAGGEA